MWKAVFIHCWILKDLTPKQRKNVLACGLEAAFLPNVFRVVEKLWAVFKLSVYPKIDNFAKF